MGSSLAARVSAHLHTERGASLIEYAFLLIFVALIAMAAVELLGGNVSSQVDSFNAEYAGP